jgi:hypothetical protein
MVHQILLGWLNKKNDMWDEWDVYYAWGDALCIQYITRKLKARPL